MKKTFKIILRLLLVLILILGIIASIYVFKGYSMYKEAVSKVTIEEKIKEIKSKADYVNFEDIPQEYINKLIKTEDKRFYSHSGVDLKAIARAVYNDLKCMSFAQGGSTLTQQVSKNMYFSFEKKIPRKIAEVFVSKKLEAKLSKDEILELHCNIVYFGEGCYGLAQASKHYFGVGVTELKSEQIEKLINTLRSPANLNPNAVSSVKKYCLKLLIRLV